MTQSVSGKRQERKRGDAPGCDDAETAAGAEELDVVGVGVVCEGHSQLARGQREGEERTETDEQQRQVDEAKGEDQTARATVSGDDEEEDGDEEGVEELGDGGLKLGGRGVGAVRTERRKG